jgi:hypothetical protein
MINLELAALALGLNESIARSLLDILEDLRADLLGINDGIHLFFIGLHTVGVAAEVLKVDGLSAGLSVNKLRGLRHLEQVIPADSNAVTLDAGLGGERVGVEGERLLFLETVDVLEVISDHQFLLGRESRDVRDRGDLLEVLVKVSVELLGLGFEGTGQGGRTHGELGLEDLLGLIDGALDD